MKYQPTEYPECKRDECFGNLYGHCRVLVDALPKCPFYKTKAQFKEENDDRRRRTMTEGEKLLKGIHLTDELFNLYDEMNMQQALDITDQIIVTVFCALNCKKGINPDDKETIQRAARLFSDHVLFKLTDFNNINWEEETDAFSNDNCSHANPKNSCGGKANGYSDDDLR